MGVGTTRTMDRIAAAIGVLDGAELSFEPADDIPNGGVLCALPALLALGLLRHAQSHFSLPKGFYPMESIFLLLAYLALGRVPSMEQLRYHAPGEWGKLLGLDRIPEVKTLRDKVGILGDDAERTARWSGELARDWMARDSQAAGVLLIDGHTRVYHGSLTKLPRRYISRERLCLRATTDYWVNALDGQPFFCVTKPIDPGLQITLETDIVPRLLNDIPNQPTTETLAADPHLHRFILIWILPGPLRASQNPTHRHPHLSQTFRPRLGEPRIRPVRHHPSQRRNIHPAPGRTRHPHEQRAVAAGTAPTR